MGSGPRRKRQWVDMTANANMGAGPTYADKVQNGCISEEEKAFLLRAMSEDFSRLEGKAGEGKKILQAKTKISMGKAMAGLHKALSCGLYFYFMGKPPTEEEFKRWFTELYAEKATLQKYHFAGKGFYQALLESETQREYVLNTVAAFKGNLVFTMPWSPNLRPEEMLLHQCPVWIEFPCLPYYLWDQISEMAEALGKVLFTPKQGQQENKNSKKACILWDRRQEIPDIVEFEVAGFKLPVEVKFQPFPDSCYKCRLQGHFAKDCPGIQKPTADTVHAEPQPPSESATASTSQALVPRGKEKVHEAPPQFLGDPKPIPKAPANEEGWKTVQKKSPSKTGQGNQAKPLQDRTNKPKPKSSIKKDARSKNKPLATMLEDKENASCSVVNLSDD